MHPADAAGRGHGDAGLHGPRTGVRRTAEIGPASDLYSAGVVLYELLTGRRPFGGDNAASMMYQIIHTAAPPPSDHRPGLDAALEATCLKAIAKKPADRFENGEKMAAAPAPGRRRRPSWPSRSQRMLR